MLRVGGFYGLHVAYLAVVKGGVLAVQGEVQGLGLWDWGGVFGWGVDSGYDSMLVDLVDQGVLAYLVHGVHWIMLTNLFNYVPIAPNHHILVINHRLCLNLFLTHPTMW